MENILIIGDQHGRSHWKDLVNQYPDTKTVFIGDFLDSFNVPIGTQVELFKEVIELVRSKPEQYDLLIGNHEYHYLPFVTSQYSGYSAITQTLVDPIFKDNMDLFKVAVEYKGNLITHAGVHRGWYSRLLQSLTNYDIEHKDVVTNINNAFKHELDCIGDCGIARGGMHPIGGPIWLCKNESRKLLKEYHHIVGHTQIPEIKTIDNVTYIDTGDENAFIII